MYALLKILCRGILHDTQAGASNAPTHELGLVACEALFGVHHCFSCEINFPSVI